MKTEPADDVDPIEAAVARLRPPPTPEPTEKEISRQQIKAFYRNQRKHAESAGRAGAVTAGSALPRRRRRKAFHWVLYFALLFVVPIVGIRVFQWYDAYRSINRAEAGDIDAAVRVAKLYSAGLGVDKSTRESARWYLVAAMAGHPGAQERIAHNYSAGWDGFPRDRNEAIRWYLASANQGWARSMREMAELYEENPDNLDGLADGYMWLWLMYAARTTRFEDDVYREGIIPDSGNYGGSSFLHDPLYDALGEDAKADAKQRAREWRPAPTARMDLTPGLEPRWWEPP